MPAFVEKMHILYTVLASVRFVNAILIIIIKYLESIAVGFTLDLNLC